MEQDPGDGYLDAIKYLKSSKVSASCEKLKLTQFCSKHDRSQDARGNYRDRKSVPQWVTWELLLPQNGNHKNCLHNALLHALWRFIM
jgi:hypothetical protein